MELSPSRASTCWYIWNFTRYIYPCSMGEENQTWLLKATTSHLEKSVSKQKTLSPPKNANLGCGFKYFALFTLNTPLILHILRFRVLRNHSPNWHGRRPCFGVASEGWRCCGTLAWRNIWGANWECQKKKTMGVSKAGWFYSETWGNHMLYI